MKAAPVILYWCLYLEKEESKLNFEECQDISHQIDSWIPSLKRYLPKIDLRPKCARILWDDVDDSNDSKVYFGGTSIYILMRNKNANTSSWIFALAQLCFNRRRQARLDPTPGLKNKTVQHKKIQNQAARKGQNTDQGCSVDKNCTSRWIVWNIKSSRIHMW